MPPQQKAHYPNRIAGFLFSVSRAYPFTVRIPQADSSQEGTPEVEDKTKRAAAPSWREARAGDSEVDRSPHGGRRVAKVVAPEREQRITRVAPVAVVTGRFTT